MIVPPMPAYPKMKDRFGRGIPDAVAIERMSQFIADLQTHDELGWSHADALSQQVINLQTKLEAAESRVKQLSEEPAANDRIRSVLYGEKIDELRAKLGVVEGMVPLHLVAAIAHRACCGSEHAPANGKLHGCCVVCGVDWPCETARSFTIPNKAEAQPAALAEALEVAKEMLVEATTIIGGLKNEGCKAIEKVSQVLATYREGR